MAFWGIEVKPKKSLTLTYGDVQGKLVLTQATLGAGGSTKKSILQCEVGDKSPVYLCTLLPDKIESCPLNLEFDEEDDVKFSVVGPTSVHLSGFIQGGSPYSDDDQEHLYGEDIAETDSEESSDYSEDSEEYDKDFINDGDMDMFPPSPVRNSGVVIEEIVDDEKPAIENEKSKQPGKKDKVELVVKGTTNVAVLESEDEDGFPISSSREKEGPSDEKPEENTEGNATKTSSEGRKKKNKKRKSETKNETKNEACCGMSHEDVPEESLKRKKNKIDKSGDEKKIETVIGDKGHPKETDSVLDATKDGEHSVAGGDAPQEKKKNKKKKKGKEGALKGESDTALTVENGSATDSGLKKSKAKPGSVRNFPNGLVVQELQMGKPDGKRASAGKKVSVRYIGKLQKNGKIFDSNIGKAPFKFILGVGQVIKGWDVGLEGMRVGDKRKLTIPPSMAYGSKSVGAIPANSWLEFSVELVEVF